MPPDDDRLDDEYEARVSRKCRRMREAREEEEASLWRYLGLLGMVGWSVAVPAVAGALIGWFVDARFETDDSWTFGLLVLGLAVGCFNAWRSITRERY